ncbi:aminoglycoside phosphotransferase family protein [Phenylobacterium sp.]|jgi:streptomycin 6-kinase|uniref:aminoglycoside phosphotransferase family protein n=1 Tax=Phenylobacterium sp. TaxID=1871053 RepID=UPI002E2F0906|nr:aminoglycoside phosphotransferase family protein [Phenylobacterium sp.]HEX2560283.1 aminoglycoside phosphotransferase family protein [Phenylobacterium sp.]
MNRFEPWLAKWGLTPDGAPFESLAGALLPVRRGEAPAMLKLATAEEEKRGAALLAWYGGEGAVRVLALEAEALLMERAVGTLTLAEMARSGEDEAATRILCETAARLHEPRDDDPPQSLVPLPLWFRELAVAANRHGGPYALAASVAQELLQTPQDIVVLHGDIHHGNVLHDAQRGWLAIDPKGVVGERGYDHANMLCNPDVVTATAPGRLADQLDVICEAAGLEHERQLMWTIAYCGLSASWTLSDGDDPWRALRILEIAAEELGVS